MTNVEFRSNIAELEGKVCSLEFENTDLKSSLCDAVKKSEVLECELASYKQKYALLRHTVYGKKSETIKANSEQMSLLFDEAEVSAAPNDSDFEELDLETNTKPASKKKGRKPIPNNLKREEVIHELSGEDLKCDCGCDLTHIGQEVSESLHHIPAKVIVKRDIRYKYACKNCEQTVRRAEPPFRPLDKTMVTSSLLSDMLVKKYEDHLPLYRQSQIWRRVGVLISRMTLSNWFLACASKIEPLIDVMRIDINNSDYVCSDETTVNVLKASGTNYMWVHMTGGRDNRAIVFEYQDSRGGESASNFLADFTGHHQCDGYSGYNDLHGKDKVTGVGCMAHARRKFMAVVKITKKSGVAHKVVHIMKGLYRIEKQIIDLPPDKIKEVRQKKAL